MSEAWTQLLRDVDNGLTRAIDLERVTISRSTGNMHAYFTSSRLLSSRERGIMERAMRAGFPKVELATSVRYPSLREKALADINAYKGAVIELVTAESPASMPYLTWSDGTWQLDGDQLTVNVNAKEGAEFLRIRGVDLMIARFLKELFDIEARVTIAVTGSEAERIRLISEKRREEEALMARAAREMTTQHEVEEPAPSLAVRGQPFTDPIISMGELTEDAGRVALMGEIVKVEMKDTKNTESKILLFTLTDYDGSVECKAFLSPKRGKSGVSLEKQIEGAKEYVKEGKWLKIRGVYKYDDFSRKFMLIADDILPAAKPVRRDHAKEKRVELHLHTQMSAMDACASPTDLIRQAAEWGHPALRSPGQRGSPPVRRVRADRG